MDSEAAELETVCYGMLEGIPVTTTETTIDIDNTSLVRACLRENGTVQRSSDGACVGQLNNIATKCFSRLIDQENIDIQLMLQSLPPQASRRKGPRVVANVSAILYGPEEAGDCVGSFLDECKLFLQDPYGCEKNVLYKNPHCLLSILEEPRMTFDLPQPGSAVFPNFKSASESLKALETTEEFPEWAQPASLRPNVRLRKHQKQALWFFVSRESTETPLHVWKKTDRINGCLQYFNDVTGKSQDVPPAVWRGGILADEMGLGKTLQMISLIAIDKESRAFQQNGSGTDAYRGPASASTLVIVPLSLMSVWEEHPDCHFQGNPILILEDILPKTKEYLFPYLLHSHPSVFQ
ncbi:SNF2 family N-terminal domain-containing protein [Triangularia verruculosa]|uniref:SNF2 family N-terminal domain-containing protein n=1 Tax=Triangularia verruculosa TaxID=2587418 RepID=A0AAN6X7B7_9PEZI|nr:SNF2 family N-terminal domain-containing protein [Triangularia verruculosa]